MYVFVWRGGGGGGSTQTNIVRLKQNVENWRRPLMKVDRGERTPYFVVDITKNAPYAWENFHACAITRFQKPQQLCWVGRG